MGSSHSKSKGFKASTTVEELATATGSTVKKPKRRNHPLEWEVLYLRRCLLFFIPVELVDLIIDHAQYWPQTSWFLGYKPDFTLPFTRHSADNNSHWLYVQCGPIDLEEKERAIQVREKLLAKKKWSDFKFSRKEKVSNVAAEKEKPKAIRKVKKVVFRIWSHDQGRGAQEPHLTGYEASFTWFEAAICPGEELPKGPMGSVRDLDYPLLEDVVDPLTLPPRKAGVWKIWHLQSNIRGSADEALHEIVWTDRDDESQTATSWNPKETGSGAGTGFVRSIQPRDVIAVVARARPRGLVEPFSVFPKRLFFWER
ncbi:uncharacterized protein LACBIDRAFT_295078 [Laccaria bicolor S238N-H82]|uniref:Predicted protein n=1 Tax=Laccaria bicolor (strain S238N-H82 / ATCC MYA-4686) TaxID=486041 RepID=B0DME0_LACBS|nr:uncharacterized protein LACBIDRAFT_295078 [Laccaria bicolor S238N-H82]EDR04267.1 predicted protein [Laccaria bicolor S238N-H82]|eukprot:XP_001885158.1 predicted protein [Laccaria bicolor S238N-H82]